MLTQLNRWNSRFKIKGQTPDSVSRGRGMAAKRGLGIRPSAKRKAWIGKRTLDWRAAWRWIKPRLEAAGRTQCEFGFIEHECYGRLDPCHSKKRREMKGTDIYDVAIGCQNVHEILDNRMSHGKMFEAVMRAINSNGGPIRRVSERSL